MNKKLVFLMICAVFGLNSTAGAYTGNFPSSTPDIAAVKLRINGSDRDLLLYSPPGISSPALMIMLSGTGSDMNSNMLYDYGADNIKAFADREGIVIAAPMQRMMTWGDWDNHSEGTPYWETAASDAAISSDPNANADLMLLNAVMDEAIRAYGVDSNRIYLIGFSNGAFFSYFAAAVLNNRVAAFAESGGGLVLSNTTAGEPMPCQPKPVSGIVAGEVRSCAELGWTPQTCNYAGAVPRPIDPKGRKIPPGFLNANDDDDTVPFAHTCNLVNALIGITEVKTQIVHLGGGHVPSENYLENAWTFMKDKRLNAGNTSICFNADDTLAIWVSCAQYSGIQYEFVLNYASVSDDPAGFYWKMNLLTLSQTRNTSEACMPISNDLKLNLCVDYHGAQYEFAMNYTPVSNDPAGIYWKAVVSTFKQKK